MAGYYNTRTLYHYTLLYSKSSWRAKWKETVLPSDAGIPFPDTFNRKDSSGIEKKEAVTVSYHTQGGKSWDQEWGVGRKKRSEKSLKIASPISTSCCWCFTTAMSTNASTWCFRPLAFQSIFVPKPLSLSPTHSHSCCTSSWSTSPKSYCIFGKKITKKYHVSGGGMWAQSWWSFQLEKKKK